MGNNAVIHLSSAFAQLGAPYNNTDKPWESVFVFRANQAANANVRVGLAYGTSATIGGGLAVRMGATNWEVCWGAGGGEQAGVIDLGDPIDTDWHTLRIYSDGITAKKAYVRWDGGTPVTACPSGCTLTIAGASSFWASNVTAIFNVITNTAVAATVDADLFAFRATVATVANRRN